MKLRKKVHQGSTRCPRWNGKPHEASFPFFFSSRRRHTRCSRDWSSDVCSSDLEMAVAYFQAHAPHGFWPIRNGGERAVFYCFFFLYVAAKGSGRFSLERPFRRKIGRASCRERV